MRLHHPTIIDFLAFIGLWELWTLIFKEKIPLGWVRARIYKRWPPDGWGFVTLAEIPPRRAHRRENKGRAWREHLVTQVPDIGYYVPHYITVDGKDRIERGWLVDGQGKYVVDPETQMIARADHALAIKQGGYKILPGEGNKFTTAFTCFHCSPVWVMLVAFPLWMAFQTPIVCLGMVGLALMVGQVWMKATAD